jgi:hypothetical protein
MSQLKAFPPLSSFPLRSEETTTRPISQVELNIGREEEEAPLDDVEEVVVERAKNSERSRGRTR